MFRKMGRKGKALAEEEARKILLQNKEGVLATAGDDGYPYAVPLNYVFHDGAIYFHCALSGHKLENIVFNPKVSFCVTAESALIAEKFDTRYKSVVALAGPKRHWGMRRSRG